MLMSYNRTYHLCEANCGVFIAAQGRTILSIKGYPKNSRSRGHVWSKF